jgi:predicted RNA-binding protein
LNVENGILDVSVANVTGAVARSAKFTAIVKNILGEGVEGIVVEFTVEDEGAPVYIGKATTDKNGLAVLTTEIPQVYDEHPRILVEINDPYHYDSTTAYGNLSARWLTNTKITPNANFILMLF